MLRQPIATDGICAARVCAGVCVVVSEGVFSLQRIEGSIRLSERIAVQSSRIVC